MEFVCGAHSIEIYNSITTYVSRNSIHVIYDKTQDTVYETATKEMKKLFTTGYLDYPE